MSIEAMKLALEALWNPWKAGANGVADAITALRQAIAEAEQATPPKRKPLTDEQIDALPLPPSGTATVRDLVRIIEAAHGIKENT